MGGRPCPSGQTHGLTDRTTPPSAELSHPRGFRRPPCPPVPCLGNPESQAALPEVRLHGASPGGHINRNRQPHLTFTDGVGNTTGDRREPSGRQLHGDGGLTATSIRPGAPAYTGCNPPQRPQGSPSSAGRPQRTQLDQPDPSRQPLR